MSPKGGRSTPGIALRRGVQILSFALFLFLLLRTEYRGEAEIRYPVNLYFLLDPYLALCASLASRTVLHLFWPALVTVGAGLLLGRAFCGWICPLGALLDLLSRLRRGSPHPAAPPLGAWRHLKYYLLLGALASSAAGFSAAWVADPFSITARAFSVSVIPAGNLVLQSLFDTLWREARFLSPLTEPVYAFLQRHVLTFDQQHFLWGGASLLLFGLVLAGEAVRPRFWCRQFCPLGAVLSLCARFALLRRRVGTACVDCGACWRRCPVGLIDQGNHRDGSRECTVCLDCREVCPHGAISFGVGSWIPDGTPRMERRRLLAGVAGGLLLPPLVRVSPAGKTVHPRLIRPPGAVDEREFLRRCIRCGSCMKVCMGNAIHPALGEAGLEGIVSPVMVGRLGYCEFNCTLCGQVCPTGALRRLTREEKQRFVLGLAVIDRNRCIPWSSPENCIVCEEHCPVADKAIRFEEAVIRAPDGATRRLLRPHVVRETCIGCGVCETKCPVGGAAAIVVVPDGETRRLPT